MATQISSRPRNAFWPKPPPTSSCVTRIRFSGSRRILASTDRTSCGFWCEIHTRSSGPNGSHRTTMPRVSIGTQVWRCWRNVARTTCGAASRAASKSGSSPAGISAATLLAYSRWTRCSVSSAARSRSMTAGAGA